jgi:hypothetical protein
MKPKIFLSHNKKDKDFIKKLANSLRTGRINVWYDDWEIPPGASLRAKIFEEGIPGCDLFFVYLTENSINSKWVKQELDAAFVTELEGKGGFYAQDEFQPLIRIMFQNAFRSLLHWHGKHSLKSK